MDRLEIDPANKGQTSRRSLAASATGQLNFGLHGCVGSVGSDQPGLAPFRGTRQPGKSCRETTTPHQPARCAPGGDARTVRDRFETDTQTDMLLGEPKSAICVQRFDDSLNSAIHTTYRTWLRSSSMHEPRDPPLKVVFFCFCLSSSRDGDGDRFCSVVQV